jgi:hypothetical protein
MFHKKSIMLSIVCLLSFLLVSVVYAEVSFSQEPNVLTSIKRFADNGGGRINFAHTEDYGAWICDDFSTLPNGGWYESPLGCGEILGNKGSDGCGCDSVTGDIVCCEDYGMGPPTNNLRYRGCIIQTGGTFTVNLITTNNVNIGDHVTMECTAPEVCDDIDNNNDGDIDEGCEVDMCTYYQDTDGDGQGNVLSDLVSECTGPPLGYVNNANDCDDSNGNAWINVANLGTDVDGDGYTLDNCQTRCVGAQSGPHYKDTTSSYIYKACQATDCRDDLANVNPSQTEDSCDGLDNNCDGSIDAADPSLLAGPLNTNQFGICGGSTNVCVAGVWDNDYSNIPNYEAIEVSCDGLDNNCDGSIDEGCPRMLSCIVDINSTDSDSDPIIYNYEWLKVNSNGSLTPISDASILSVTSEEYNENVYVCKVTATDTYETSQPAYAVFTHVTGKTYIPFGSLETEVTELGSYSGNDNIPRYVEVVEGQTLDYTADITCIGGECGYLSGAVDILLQYAVPRNTLTFIQQSEAVTTASTQIYIDSPRLFQTAINTTIASEYSILDSVLTDSYFLEGMGALESNYSSGYLEVVATVTYVDGSDPETFYDDVTLNASVANITFTSTLFVTDARLIGPPIPLSANTFTSYIENPSIGNSNILIQDQNSASIFRADSKGITTVVAQVTPAQFNDDPEFKFFLEGIASETFVVRVSEVSAACVEDIFLQTSDPVILISDVFDSVTKDIEILDSRTSLPVSISSGTFTSVLNTGAIRTHLSKDYVGNIEDAIALYENSFEIIKIPGGNVLQLRSTNSFDNTTFQSIFGETLNVEGSTELPLNFFNVSYTQTSIRSCEAVNASIGLILKGNTFDSCEYRLGFGARNHKSGVRNYYWKDLASDSVTVEEKCYGEDEFSIVLPDRMSLLTNPTGTNSGIEVVESRADGKSCNPNAGPGVGSNCFLITKLGSYDIDALVDGVQVASITANSYCAYFAIDSQDDELSANNRAETGIVHPVNGTNVIFNDVSVLCDGDYAEVSGCVDLNISEEGALAIVSNNLSLFSTSRTGALWTGTVLECNQYTPSLPKVQLNLSFQDTDSFCQLFETTEKFDLPNAHVRDTICSSQNAGVDFLVNHVSYHAKSIENENTVLTNYINLHFENITILLGSILNDSEMLAYFDSNVTGFFNDFRTDPIMGWDSGPLDSSTPIELTRLQTLNTVPGMLLDSNIGSTYDAPPLTQEEKIELVTFLSGTRGFDHLGAADLPSTSRLAGDEFKSLYAVKKQYVLNSWSDGTHATFNELVTTLFKPKIQEICNHYIDSVTFISQEEYPIYVSDGTTTTETGVSKSHVDQIKDLCPRIVLSMYFDPGFYVSSATNEAAYCYVDLDAADLACCEGIKDCVYEGGCYAPGEEILDSDIDKDGLTEICIESASSFSG